MCYFLDFPNISTIFTLKILNDFDKIE